jgi:hypothetical protein
MYSRCILYQHEQSLDTVRRALPEEGRRWGKRATFLPFISVVPAVPAVTFVPAVTPIKF